MPFYKELEYTSNVDKVIGVQFGIMSPDEIRSRSVVEVVTQETYNGNEPVIGGLFDPRMGVIDHGKICPTDGLDNKFCPGYFGHIELARPVFHIQYFTIVQKIMRCICFRCGKLLIDKYSAEVKEILKKKGKGRWNEIFSISGRIKRCGQENEDGCGAKQPSKYVRDGVGKIYGEWKDIDVGTKGESSRQYFYAEDILKLFRRISDDDCEILGFSRYWCRPDWMICQALPVPPPSVRPSVRQEGQQRMEDDLTHKLVDIIKTNKTLKGKIDNNASNSIIDEWTMLLQYHVATLVDNEIPNVAPAQQRSGRPLKSIRQRLKTKEGRIRGNLMGKRVDFSARSVITPDPNIGIHELGVPRDIAMNLTYPEKVTKYNIDKMYELVRNGPDKYPGAKTIKKVSEDATIHLNYVVREDIVLEYGDEINRHLMDGDVVLFNRQPSLHKMSMMGHKIKVMDYSTFRLNVSVTSPYNADFDGDEMNMHVPQSIQSAMELEHLASVPLQIISPQSNKPIIGIVQDSLLGSYRITRNETELTKQQFMNLMMWNKDFTGQLPDPSIKNVNDKGYDLWRGRQVLSEILPNVNVMMGGKNYDNDVDTKESENYIKIINGIVKQGRWDKDIFTKTSRGLVHVIFNDYGPKEAQKFLDNVQNVITNYLLISGFSVGVSDLIANNKTKENIKEAITDQVSKVTDLIQHVHLNIFENHTGKTNQEEFETQVMGILSKATNIGGKIGVKNLDKDNRILNMVKSGSKGSSVNVSQMIACLGQQAVDGKRIPYGFNDRTLPHFSKYDDGPEARGFVESSFMKGLTPQEFFFHAMGGREGLIDTAVKTSETGYIQRKLVKAMEDLKISYDNTVRNASGCIVEFIYGEDGMDSTKIECQILPISDDSYDTFVEKYQFVNDENWELFLKTNVVEEMTEIEDYRKQLDDYFQLLIVDQSLYIRYICNYNPSNGVYYPVNVERIIQNAINNFNITKHFKSDLSPLEVIKETKELIASISVSKNNKGNVLLGILLRHYLNPVLLLKKHRINKDAFKYITTRIRQRFYEALVNPGEMVGAIAAQSIGEPATQMTLNTFHLAGVAEKSNVTRGVPRLKELLHISKNPKSPGLTVYLKPEYAYDKEKSQNILNNIELTSLKDITVSSKIYYDPNDYDTKIEHDKKLLELYHIFEDVDPICHDKKSSSDWILRLEFDRRYMMNKNISMDDVHFAISNAYGSDISCIYSDDNSSNLIARIRVNQEDSGKKSDQTDDINLLKTLETNLLDKIILRGVSGISKVTMRSDRTFGYYEGPNFVRKPQWVLDTSGVNLLDILAHPAVNFPKTISNDIYEVYDNLGIEAARMVLFEEINNVIAFEGAYVNSRHLSLLVDIMTTKGTLMSIDRHGINRGDIGPLAKCSFEETTDQLLKAAIFGDSDKVSGVSSNIMMGQIAPCGTGDCTILFDEIKFLNELQTIREKEEVEDDEEISNLSEIDLSDDEDDPCSINNLTFKFNKENVKEKVNLFNIPKTTLQVIED
jgi:DNA-directed RNA polymerase II subunit RPB1